MTSASLERVLIICALGKSPLELPALAVAIGGMYPADLRSLLADLEREGSISCTDGTYFLAKPSPPPPQPDGLQPPLSLLPPHPANMDWRYEASTARLLAERSLAGGDGSGLFIGSPSAYAYWRRLAPARPALLLDASEAMVQTVNGQVTGTPHSALCFDMCRPLDWTIQDAYDVCLCDPPWYREHYLGAIGIASLALRLGARLLVSVLPPLARPGASADRCWIIQQADQLGFHLLSLEQNALRYLTPAFERGSLAAAGIEIPSVWRCGDLATFVKVREPDPHIRAAILSPLANMELAERELAEVLVRGQIWRLRGPFDDIGVTPELISIEANDILSTVSRRYQGRSKIDLWLPDNRVFGVRGRAAFRHAMTLIGEKESAALSSACEDATIDEARRLLESLLAIYEKSASPERHIS